jgi:hypothetical protein
MRFGYTLFISFPDWYKCLFCWRNFRHSEFLLLFVQLKIMSKILWLFFSCYVIFRNLNMEINSCISGNMLLNSVIFGTINFFQFFYFLSQRQWKVTSRWRRNFNRLLLKIKFHKRVFTTKLIPNACYTAFIKVLFYVLNSILLCVYLNLKFIPLGFQVMISEKKNFI